MCYEKKEIEYIIEYLNCPCEVFRKGTQSFSMKKYLWYLKEGKIKGYTPLILCMEPCNQLFIHKSDKSRRKFIRKSKKYKITSHELCYSEYYEDCIKYLDEYGDKETIIDNAYIRNKFSSYLDREENLNYNIVLAKIPTKKPWKVGAYLYEGGHYEYDHQIERQISVMEYWYSKYRAIPAVVSHNKWEFYVEKLPHNIEEAKLLAMEHFVFCFDRVAQHSSISLDEYTLKELALELLHSHVWFFWWD
ncbi:DUF4253 domain-containing protein [Clostridium sp. JS66]|uniref:DUF4253 domain-containing protein n=1 Tax=Clostridium sp. JS66 TaxID=3064705 RepID=UPI00298EB4B6|nr:DUF4253 domain-containing protein [Clostridium sp. JS66]WPC43407.1 DUF4253 domain-containing protein [Clostridium sp. JS66]